MTRHTVSALLAALFAVSGASLAGEMKSETTMHDGKPTMQAEPMTKETMPMAKEGEGMAKEAMQEGMAGDAMAKDAMEKKMDDGKMEKKM